MTTLHHNQRGFTMLIAVVTGTILLLIAYGMASIALRQQVLASGARDSQAAFYAADASLECAEYLDTDQKAFAAKSTDTAHPAAGVTRIADYCGSVINPVQSVTRIAYTPVGGVLPAGFVTQTQTFKIEYDIVGQQAICSQVTVTKSRSTGSSPDAPGTAGQLKTLIDSRGYNTCDSASPSRLERAIRAVYYEAFQ